MSIRARLTVALGVLLLATIAAIITALLIDARHRVQTEVSSSLRTAETLLLSSLESIEGAERHPEKLADLVSRLKTLRHVRVHLASEGRVDPKPQETSSTDTLATLFAVEPGPSVLLPVRAAGKVVDTLVIAPVRNDEFDEVLETIARVAVYAFAFAAAAFAVTSLLVKRALAPVLALDTALHALEDGNYDIGVPQQGPPEIARICVQLNRLATALQRSREENQRLATAMVRVQDEERRDIARDLHDELGPFLFSIRATGSALARQIETAKPDREKLAELTAGMLEHVDALQATNRRVLQQLSPVGLAELGLSGALKANAAMWRKQPDSCEITLEIDDDIDDLDSTVSTTVYRIVQEGLTNAFRHAGASRIAVSIRRRDGVDTRRGQSGSVTVSIVDDGEGLPDEVRPGFGLKGMKERVRVLGGTIEITREGARGTRIEALLPAPRANSA